MVTVDTILYYISQYIKNTWGFYLEPSSMDLRWSDSTGDTFALRNHQLLLDLPQLCPIPNYNLQHTLTLL